MRFGGWGVREGDATPVRAGTLPPSPPPFHPLFFDSSTFPLNFRDSLFWVLPWGKSSNVIVKVLYLACHMLRLRLRLSFSLVTRGHKKCKRLGGGREGGAPSPPPPPPHPHHTTTTTTAAITTSPPPTSHHHIAIPATPPPPAQTTTAPKPRDSPPHTE